MIGLKEFKIIFDCKKKIDFWFFDNNCEIDSNGIRGRLAINKDDNQLPITDEERKILKISGNNIKLDFPCTCIELFDWCKKNNWIEKLISSDFVSKEHSRVLLNSEDREKLDTRILKSGPPTTSIRHFIDFVLTDAIGGNYDAIQTFYHLIEENGLVIYDKVIDGKPIDTKNLINSLKKREQQADDAFGDDNFQFWDVLEKECKHSIYRDNVKEAYKNAGQLKFPWVTWNNKFIWLDYLSDNSNGMEDKIKLKQELSKEPVSLNLVYTPPKEHQIEKNFVQRNWEAIPDVNQKYWKHRDTLNIIELAFILKGKEPQAKAKANQSNVINFYPLKFCEFIAKLLTLSDSSWKVGALIEVNPPTLYCEEWVDTPEFKRKELIEWAVSKEIDVPVWLIDIQQDIQTNTEPKTKNTPTAKPWLEANPKDPKPKYDWYTAARYFARQLVGDDSTLLNKRNLLTKKIVTSLTKAGIKKRGGIKPFDPNTIKKALSNIELG